MRLLDTNVCIYLIKEHPVSVLERFAAHPVGDIGISVITLAELEYGVTKSSRPSDERWRLVPFSLIPPTGIVASSWPVAALMRWLVRG